MDKEKIWILKIGYQVDGTHREVIFDKKYDFNFNGIFEDFECPDANQNLFFSYFGIQDR